MAHAHSLCPMFEAAMEVLAKPWSGILINTLEDGPLRFSEIGARVGTIGDRMLSLRLRELEARGLVIRSVEPGPPVRVAYSLTEVGRGFREVSTAVARWGHAISEAQKQAKKHAPKDDEPALPADEAEPHAKRNAQRAG